MTKPFGCLRLSSNFCCVLLAAFSIGFAAASPAAHARRVSPGMANSIRSLSLPDKSGLAKPATSLGPTGTSATDHNKPFSMARGEDLAARIERLANSGATVENMDALQQALDALPAFRNGLAGAKANALSEKEILVLAQQETELENLEGIALKGMHHAAAYYPPQPAALPEGMKPSVEPGDSVIKSTATKTNTGWILDQHVFDYTSSPKPWPTLLSDYEHYDEGRNDITIGHSDHPDANSEFGWVWQVQTFYWTDTATVTNHANASYCLFVLVSGDGGFTWQLYAIIYDPTSVSHTTSLDLINPKMAIDITGTYDQFYIAYEYCYSLTDHDVYVYSDTSTLPFYNGTAGGTSNPHTIAIATSTQMEKNPVIASDYMTTDTTHYQVVAYEYGYSATDTDVYAAQSYGNGSTTWTTPVAVASTVAVETNPALAIGCSGGSTFTAYAHLAYNYDTFTGGTQVLLNPGFESGNTGNWVVRVPGDISCNGADTNTGTCKAWLGGVVSNANDWIYQDITVPALTFDQAAHFSFWLKIASTDSTTVPHDYFYAEVDNRTSGNLLQMLATLSNADQTAYASYTQLQFDLSKYAGQTIRIRFWSSNDATYATSFFVDDTSLSADTYSDSEVRYVRAAHPLGTAPGTTPYPNGLSGFSPLTVLADIGGTTAWPYGPPAIAASHGGSTTVTGGRVLLAADQIFPANQPNSGDPQRYQLTYAVNMCNGTGGTSCGNISGCSPAVSLNWNAYYFYDNAADYRFPALVVDGVGWLQGSTAVPQNGVATWPGIFIGYYYRGFKYTSPYGDVRMVFADASDETCTGFASGAMYMFTASETASDGDQKVVAKPGTLAAFNYFAGWPGAIFNKRLDHVGATTNDDVYFTTPGDDYVIDTLFSGTHIDAHWTFNGVLYLGPWTYAWPAGIGWTLTADSAEIYNSRYYMFSSWTTGDTNAATTITSNYCAAVPPATGCPAVFGCCPTTSINALYGGGCLVSLPEVTGLLASNQSGNVSLTWPLPGQPGDVGQYAIYRATSPTAAGNFSLLDSTMNLSYVDKSASGPIYYYIVVATCGPYSGPWGHFGR